MGDFTASPDRIGRLWEHLVIQTIRSTAQALDRDFRVSVFRTASGAEVDLILEDGPNLFAIEIKATKRVTASDFRGLVSFAEFIGKRKHRSFVVSMDEHVQEFSAGLVLSLGKLWEYLGWEFPAGTYPHRF